MASAIPYDIICIGGGAAGFFTAISAAEAAKKLAHTPIKIAILEAGRRPLTKVKISGGGRCNVTHNQLDPKLLIQNYPRGAKKLINGFFQFGPQEMIAWLEAKGVSVKTESDGRIFPTSNNSQTIIDLFSRETQHHDIEVIKGQLIKKIENVKNKDSQPGDHNPSMSHFKVESKTNTFLAKKVMLATGSMPAGYTLAQQLGHELTPLVPSLFTLKSSHPIVDGLAGISWPNTELQFNSSKPYKFSGPLLITHWGFSGPAVLKLSAFAAIDLHKTDYKGELKVDWCPDISFEKLNASFQDEKRNNGTMFMRNRNPTNFPKRLWQRWLLITDLKDKRWCEASNKQIDALTCQLKKAVYPFKGKGEFKEEFVTCGGVKLSDVDLKTFESRFHPGLYFAGEILNIDGVTGGFNFQNAWTSSWLAAQHMVKNLINT